jgi:hypothetical protein
MNGREIFYGEELVVRRIDDIRGAIKTLQPPSLPAGGDVPDADESIGACRGDSFTVGREREAMSLLPQTHGPETKQRCRRQGVAVAIGANRRGRFGRHPTGY